MGGSSATVTKLMRNITMLTVLLFLGCTSSEDGPVRYINVSRQIEIDAFSDSLFQLTKIDLIRTLDSMRKMSDTIHRASHQPNHTILIYSNRQADIHFEVILNQKNLPRAISYFRSGEEVNASEYYQNGQVICQHPSIVNAKRNGRYTCFDESGKIDKFGYYRNNVDVGDTSRVVSE